MPSATGRVGLLTALVVTTVACAGLPRPKGEMPSEPRPPEEVDTNPGPIWGWRAGPDHVGDMGGYELTLPFDGSPCRSVREFEGGLETLEGSCELHSHDVFGFAFTIDGERTLEETLWGKRNPDGTHATRVTTRTHRERFEARWFDQLPPDEQASWLASDDEEPVDPRAFAGGLVVNGRVYTP